MPAVVIEKFERFFPNIMAEKYKQIAQEHIDINKIEVSIAYYEKAIALIPESAACWNDLSWAYSHHQAYEKAFQATDKAIELATTVSQKATFLSNKASDLQRCGKLEACAETAETARKLLDTVPAKGWEGNDYFSYALASQILGLFEEALQYYDLCEQNSYTYSDGSFYYNKACVYARLGQKDNMVKMLKTCIERDSIDWISEVRHDTDFQAFWQDPIIDKLQKIFDKKSAF